MSSAQGEVPSELEQARAAPGFGAHTPLSEKLLGMAIRAQNFTGSTGIAIALTEGQEMVCRANWGTSAPEVGAKLSIEHSFTGLCVRTGEPVRCDEAQTDPHVDPEACQALGISAIAAAPLRRGPKVIGVIAAFSDTPRAFTDKHLCILTTISDVIVELLDDRHSVQPLPQIVETAPDPARAAAATQVHVTLSADRATVTIVAPEAAAPPAQADLVGHLAPTAPVQSEPPVAAAPLASAPPVTPSFSAAAATPAWFSRLLGAPRRMTLRIVSQLRGRRMRFSPTQWIRVHHPSRGKPGDLGSAPLTLLQPTVAPAADFRAARTLTFGELKSDSSSRRRLLLAAVLAIFAVIAVAGWRAGKTSMGTHLPAMSAPELTQPPTPQPEQVQGMVPARLVQRVEPLYPEAARRLSISGRVTVKATITKTGAVSNVLWVSGNNLFRDSAITAVKQWRYKPATLNGEPVESDMEIILLFALF